MRRLTKCGIFNHKNPYRKTGIIVLLMMFSFVKAFAQPTYTHSICSGDVLSYTPTALNPPTTVTYTWAIAAPGAGATNAQNGTNQASVTQGSAGIALTSSASSDVTITYNVTASDVNYNFTLVLTVRPAPRLTNTVTTTSICSGGGFSYPTASPTVGTSVTWSRTGPASIVPNNANGTGDIIEGAITNSLAIPTQIAYTVVLSAAGCNNQQQVVVTVNPLPTISNIAVAPVVVCSGSSYLFSANSSQAPNVTYSWNRPVVTNILNSAVNTNTGVINEVLTSNATAAVQVNYYFTLTNISTGCTNTQTISPNVNPTPVLTSPATATVCSGVLLNYTPTSTLAGTSIGWTRAVAPGINNNSGSGTTISEVLLNTSNAAATATYFFTLDNSGCISTTNVVATVNPLPRLTSTIAPGAVCSGVPFIYHAVSNQDPNINFVWTRAANANISNPGGTPTASADINETLGNTGNTTAAVIYSFVSTNISTGCTNTENVTVNINPIPIINNYAIPVCNGNGFVSTPANAPPGTTYTWATPNIAPAGAVIGLGGKAAELFVNESVLNNTDPGNAVVTYQVTPSLQGCNGAPFNVTATVSSGVATAVNINNNLVTPVCSGVANNFNYLVSSNSPAPTFEWNRVFVTGITNPASSSGAPANTPGSIVETLVNNTTVAVTTYYAVTVSSGGCSNGFVVAVPVNPVAQLTSTLTPIAICSNSTFNYTPTANVTSTTFTWSKPSVTGINPGLTAGAGTAVAEVLTNTTAASIPVQYIFTLTTPATCISTATVTVAVNPLPTLSSVAPTAICSGQPLSYIGTSNTTGTTFSWSRPTALNIDNPVGNGVNNLINNELLINNSTSAATAIYNFTLSANGCSNQQQVSAVVNPVPIVSNKTALICSGNTFTIVPGTVPAATQYTWAAPVSNPLGMITTGSAQGVPQNNISQALSNLSTATATLFYAVTPTASGCSGLPFVVAVTVDPRPVINTPVTIAAVCSGTPFLYTPTAIPAGTIYRWNIPVQSPSTNITGGSGAVAQPTISQTLFNSSTAAGQAEYNITPSYNGCDGNAFDLTVPVSAVPKVSSGTLNTAICSGNSFTVNPSPVPAGTAYTWVTPVVNPAGTLVGSVANNFPAATISQLLTNTTFVQSQSVYTVIPVSGSCTGGAFSFTVTVNPATELSTTLTPNAICSNTVFNYAPLSNTANTSFTWTRTAIAGINNASATSNANAGNPLEPLVNITAAPITVTYSYALTTPANCTNTQNVIIVVNPTPRLNSNLLPADICSGNTFSYAPTSLTTSTSFAWTRNAITNILPATTNSGLNNPNELLVNNALAPIQVIYDYTLTANACSNNEQVKVYVNPIPVVTDKATEICSNSLFTVAPTGVPAATTYSWGTPVSNPGGVLNGTAASTQTNISQLLTNATLSSATSLYTVVPMANNCSGNAFSVTVTVKPVPVANSKVLTAVCSGTPVSYTPANLPVGTQFSWSNPNVTPSQGLTGGTSGALLNTFNQTLSSSNNIANTAVYTVTPTANLCTGSSFQITVPVNPVPVVGNVSRDICSGNSFTVTPTGVPTGTTYTWTIPVTTPNGTVNGSGPESVPQVSISQVLSNSTTAKVQTVYTVTPVSGSCAGTNFDITIGINPATQLNLSITPPAICSNTQFSYAAGSNTPGTVFQWTRAVVAGISNAARSGANDPLETLVNITAQPITVTYAYALTTPAGCSNAQTVSVLVNPTPELTSLSVPPAICSGTQFNYTPLSNVAGTTFAWTRSTVAFISNMQANGIDNPAEFLVNTSVNSVNTFYDYTLTRNGCTRAARVTVTVNATPVVANQTLASCTNVAFNYAPLNVPSNTTYTWTTPVINPLGSVSGATAETAAQNNISQLLINQTLNPAAARYTVTPTAGSCTGAAFFVDVTLNPAATIANHTLPAVCSGTPFAYTPSNVPVNTVYTWANPVITPGSGLTGGGAEQVSRQNISQTLSSSNNIVNNALYTVTPSTNGCLGPTFTLSVFVNPTPVVNNMRDTICTGSSFTLTSTSPVPSNTLYTWASPQVFPFGAIIGGTPQPTPAPTISQTLFNTTIVPAQAVYTVTPQAGGCVGNTFTLAIVVGAVLPNIPNQLATVCSGSAFNATPVNQPPNTTYTWSTPVVTPAGTVTGIGAVSTPQATVSQVLDNAINNNSTVVYTVSAKNSGCISNNFTATITVLPVPRTFVTGNATICRYPLDTLTVNFTGTAPWGFTYFDGTTNTPHVVSGIAAAPYQLVIPSSPLASRTISFLNASHNGCVNQKDTVRFTQIINSLPVGVIHSLHGTYICNNILDTMFVTSPEVLTYQWMRNGTVITGAADDSIATNVPGRYNVMMVNQFGCRDTAAIFQPKIYIPQPVLRLTYDTYCINTPMNFSNITDTNLIGPTAWQWSFDNGTTASSFHSSTSFATGGDHHITLKATQLYCPTFPTSIDTTININFPIPGVTMPSMSAYKGQSTPVSVRNIPGYKYRWTPPFGINAPDSANTFFNNQTTQQYAINLISPAGCITKDSLLIRVFDDKLVEIMIPKSFTPNGDGINDILYPYLSGIKEFKYFKVYNRFNQPMFETKNYDVGWNGTLNGTPQPMAIYIWVAVGVALDGSMVERKGQVLLLR